MSFPTIVTARIRGGEDSVRALLAGLPGDHQPESTGTPDVYRIATTNEGFLKFAITNQGYGEVLT